MRPHYMQCVAYHSQPRRRKPPLNRNGDVTRAIVQQSPRPGQSENGGRCSCGCSTIAETWAIGNRPKHREIARKKSFPVFTTCYFARLSRFLAGYFSRRWPSERFFNLVYAPFLVYAPSKFWRVFPAVPNVSKRRVARRFPYLNRFRFWHWLILFVAVSFTLFLGVGFVAIIGRIA